MKTAGTLGNRRGAGSVRRISISLPERISRELDQMVAERGLENLDRSSKLKS
jgi:metal-responsive CopG/Arc/MetJ family transcriptional regulator